ncbi:hypothetical protein GUITHDRAFT_113959 [Guillardia theta CCMP2712]|uniref:Uncharacterized protein n=1 Tax=Guillardia theta (strain CCMP2712) TaxID=905079 RepID=L1IV42_GUITC|nr:hypothetical protein GUITHDRAFT_113959 [Guillardia theta CCMP2712]EKX39967.1 hypothetical protein GUITHDRAFT_113959 [Guillardia theta CCMP2712]|eukprot:XP_005826947.1 hypothetical protein GUITHDRAFT_113959 [Guillardia theta CCMP2712]
MAVRVMTTMRSLSKVGVDLDVLKRQTEALKNIPKEERVLGEIVIAIPYVRTSSISRWCVKNKVPIATRLPELMAHGICHCLHYDHENEFDYRIMKARELLLLRKVRTESWEAAVYMGGSVRHVSQMQSSLQVDSSQPAEETLKPHPLTQVQPEE